MTEYERIKAWRRANPEKFAAQKRRNRARRAARRRQALALLDATTDHQRSAT